jgi:hypothetical protein
VVVFLPIPLSNFALYYGIMNYGLDHPGSFPVGAGVLFSPPPRHDRLWGPGALFPGVGQPGHEVAHSVPSSTEVKNS